MSALCTWNRSNLDCRPRGDPRLEFNHFFEPPSTRRGNQIGPLAFSAERPLTAIGVWSRRSQTGSDAGRDGAGTGKTAAKLTPRSPSGTSVWHRHGAAVDKEQRNAKQERGESKRLEGQVLEEEKNSASTSLPLAPL